MGADLAAEEPFGPYLVYERLGVGGMATVHRALERGIEGFERIVALKRLLPHLAEDASFIKSFVREAKLASLLNHVNVVQIFELGRVGSQYFISMEYIDGRDIRRILRHARKVTGPPPIHVTVGLLLQLCEALDYAHNRADEQGTPLGLVHRDVSPSNLLVTLGGHLKVIDFGIAKAQSSQLRTQTGRVKGKLAYMAPEAISSGKDLDARSDLFAVGVIAHELLTARPLFASKNEYQTLMKVQRGDIVTPSTFNQACPSELDEIVLKALARDPDDRYTGAGELRDELLELRRQYNLQTGHRDVAQWLDWAFSLEPPSGFATTNTFEKSGSSAFDMKSAAGSDRPLPVRAQDKPRAHSVDDEEVVEIAWGGGEREHDSGHPVLLEDVPDISDRHRVIVDDGLMDDIPAPQPSHGHPSRPPRDTAPTMAAPDMAVTMALPAPLPPPPPVRARTSQPVMPGHGSRERRSTAQGTGSLDRVVAPNDTSSPVIKARPARSLTELAGLLPTPDPDGSAPVPRHTPPNLQQARVPGTRPGVEPARALTNDPADTTGASMRASSVTIGSSIVARQSVRRSWVYLVAGLAIAAVVGGLVLASNTASTPAATREPAVTKAVGKPIGTLKFAIEPNDAEIAIEGKGSHVGSPWSIELAPAMYQIRIQRDGYKARLKTVELSPSETMTLDLELEKIGRDASQAKLILSSTPTGLEVLLDGKLQDKRTPLEIGVSAGKHTIAMRQNGVEVWRQEVDAQPGVDHEFSPSMTAAKQRERAQRVAGDLPKKPVAVASNDRTVDLTPKKSDDQPTESKVDPKAGDPKSDVPKPVFPGPFDPKPTTPVVPAEVKPTPPVVPPPVAAPRGPINVAPHVVKRLSGETPSFKKSRNADVPAMVNAKLCIDTGGRITSVDVLTKQLERQTALDMMSTIRTWRYAPFTQNNVAAAVCFVVSFRLK
ncbi:MAG: protein kinase [Kofleriaceae bacterium]